MPKRTELVESWCRAGTHPNGSPVWGTRLWRWQVYLWRTERDSGSTWSWEVWKDRDWIGGGVCLGRDSCLRAAARLVGPKDADGRIGDVEDGLQIGRFRYGAMDHWIDRFPKEAIRRNAYMVERLNARYDERIKHEEVNSKRD